MSLGELGWWWWSRSLACVCPEPMVFLLTGAPWHVSFTKRSIYQTFPGLLLPGVWGLFFFLIYYLFI